MVEVDVCLEEGDTSVLVVNIGFCGSSVGFWDEAASWGFEVVELCGFIVRSE